MSAAQILVEDAQTGGIVLGVRHNAFIIYNMCKGKAFMEAAAKVFFNKNCKQTFVLPPKYWGKI